MNGSLLLSIISLLVSLVAVTLAFFAFKIRRDNNIINYVKMNLDLLRELPNLQDQDKELIRSLLVSSEFFEQEDDELRRRVMSL